MIVRKAYKFRLKTNIDVHQKLFNFAGQSRFVWNKILKWNQSLLGQRKRIIRYNEMCFWLTLWKQSEDYGFLKESHSQILQQTLKDLDRAFRDAFDKKQPNKRVPRLKKRKDRQSFRYVQGVKVDNRRIFLPKVGWVGFFKSQPIEGTLKNVTVSLEAGHWYVSIQTEQKIEKEPVHTSSKEVGIDVGVACFASLSDGQLIQSPHSFRKSEHLLRKHQRRLSRKTRGSHNWKKQLLKVQKCHRHIANQRKNFLHQTSTDICKNHAIVYLEDLKVGYMSRSAKGTKETPGKNVKAKSGLNKSILDQGWSEFRRQLTYKMGWIGGRVVTVPPRHTSQKCFECGHVSAENRPSQSVFHCIKCGHEDHADINAARNIKAVGQTVAACQANLTRGRQQEPLGTCEKVPA